MAKRDNSKFGVTPKARGKMPPAPSTSTRKSSSTTSRSGSGPAVRPSRADRAPRGLRAASPKAAGTQRELLSAPVAENQDRSGIQARPGPFGATVSRRAADRLRAGHLWVYASDVVAVSLPKPEDTLLPVADNRGLLLGKIGR